jgi:hypothetical protein
VEELDAHGAEYWAAVEEEEVAAGTGVLHRALYELHDGVTLELCEPSE